MNRQGKRLSWRLVGLSWLAMIGFDFLLHGGVLARWYVEPSPFLLTPSQSFARIPLGYASFVLVAILLVWTFERVATVENWRRGGALGLWIGGLVWGSDALGLFSISTAPVGLLVGWFVGQTVEVGIAGVVVGAALGGQKTKTLLFKTLAFVFAAIALTIALQTLGLAPALKK